MKWLKILAGAAAGLYAFYYFAFPTYTHRFRLTFQVEVDGKVKEGSGVITVMDQDNQWVPMTQKRWSRTVKGPAPWVDLGDKGILLVSMVQNRGAENSPRAYPAGRLSFAAFFGVDLGDPKIDIQSVREIHNQVGQKELRTDQWPYFIWLPNPADPGSALLVFPADFSNVIGPSIRLAKVAVEITKNSPDDTIYRKLHWLAAMEKSQFWSGAPWSREFKLRAVDVLGGQ